MEKTPPNHRGKNDIVLLPKEELPTKMNHFCTRLLRVGVADLQKEYDCFVKNYVPPECRITAFKANPSKNRYDDMACIDSTRVILKDGYKGNYIHANHIRGDPFSNHFICTQGPNAETLFDFWRMVVQEKAGHIVMLCDLVEDKRKKCERYWPAESGQSMKFKDFTVFNLGIQNKDPQFTVTTLEVRTPDSNLKLRHHHWKNWPDKKVPVARLAIFRLLKIVRQSTRASVVHCSAGVGRTGTLVAVEMLLQEVARKGNDTVSLKEVVHKLRGMRLTSVQTDLQYIFCVISLCEFARSNRFLDDEAEALFTAFKKDFDKTIASRGTGAGGVMQGEIEKEKGKDTMKGSVKKEGEKTVDG